MRFEVIVIFEVEASGPEGALRQIEKRLSRAESLLPRKAAVLLKVIPKEQKV